MNEVLILRCWYPSQGPLVLSQAQLWEPQVEMGAEMDQ